MHAPLPSEKRTDWRFVLFLAAYVVLMTALRGQYDLRYNDTMVLGIYVNPTLTRIDSPAYWRQVWAPDELLTASSDASLGTYRPLQQTYGMLAAFNYCQLGPLPDYFACFLLLALSAYFIFQLFRAVGSTQLAWLSATAYLFFPAVVSPAWNPLAGPQSIIPGALALGIWSYLRYLETARAWRLWPIALICLIGPYYKETLGLLPILLLVHQLVIAPAKKPYLIAGLVLASAHGLFPSLLAVFLLTGQVCFVSIFRCGALHDHYSAHSFRPNFPLDLAGFLPPSLLAVALIAVAVTACLRRPTVQVALPRWLARGGIGAVRAALPVLALGCLATLAYATQRWSPETQGWLFFLSLITLGLYGLLYVDVLIAGWFFALFLPLMRIYFNTTQCGYLAAPLLYLLIASVADLWAIVRERMAPSWWLLPVRVGLVLLGLVAFLDNALSLPNAVLAYSATEQFNNSFFDAQLTAELQAPNVDRHWCHLENTVVVNDPFGLTTRFRATQGCYNFDYGVPPGNVIRTDAELQRILENYHCVLAIGEYVNPHKRLFWDMTDLEPHFHSLGDRRIRFTGYYLDPLRYFTNNRYRSMMGPPDFQDEFALSKKWFRETFTNRFRLSIRYRSPLAEQSVPCIGWTDVQLVEENVAGYNLIACGGRFYGLGQGEGVFDLRRVRRGGYQRCIEGASLAEVKSLIALEASETGEESDRR